MVVELAGLRLELPESWQDITEDLEPGSSFTLARQMGVGALQFTVANYRGGKPPHITQADLRTLCLGFSNKNSLNEFEPLPLERAQTLCVGGVSIAPKELIAVWYLSDGTNVVLATYTSLEPSSEMTLKEVSEATDIVRTIEFAPR